MSLPITTRWRWVPRLKMRPAAWPRRSAVAASIGAVLAVPRMPSVPNRRRRRWRGRCRSMGAVGPRCGECSVASRAVASDPVHGRAPPWARPAAQARQTRSACTVSATSCTRRIAAPRAAAARAAATLGASAPARGRLARDAAEEALAGGAEQDAAAEPGQQRQPRRCSARLCAIVLPKPMPGSTAIRPRGMPSALRRVHPLAQERAPPPAPRRRSAGRAAWRAGRGPACASAPPARRARRPRPSPRGRAGGADVVDDLAPRRPAPPRMVAALRVSMETGAAAASARTTGRTRRISSSGGDRRRRRAGCTRRRCRAGRRRPPAWRARGRWRPRPIRASPSPEKLSGVTLTMPMTSGRSGARQARRRAAAPRSRRRQRRCQSSGMRGDRARCRGRRAPSISRASEKAAGPPWKRQARRRVRTKCEAAGPVARSSGSTHLSVGHAPRRIRCRARAPG